MPLSLEVFTLPCFLWLILVFAATQSGKTSLVLRLLKDLCLFNPQPSAVYLCFDQWQSAYDEAAAALKKQGVSTHLLRGIDEISLDQIPQSTGETLIFLDDFSYEANQSNDIMRIFTNGRHKHVSCYLSCHSLYSKHAQSRVIAQNAQYMFLLPSLRLTSQLRILGGQLGMKDQLLAAYKLCIEDTCAAIPHLLVDLQLKTPSFLRLRSHVHSYPQFCYI